MTTKNETVGEIIKMQMHSQEVFPNDTFKNGIKTWLEDNGYDGLYNSEGECGCDLKDLMPCGGVCDDCEAGYKIAGNEECDWFMARNKEAKLEVIKEVENEG